jgi:4-hydroxy-tetrahydrodipicolinate reductase
VALDIIINGAMGRMGAEIANIVLSDNALKLKACIEYAGHPQAGQDYGTLIGKGPIGVLLTDSLSCQDLSGAVIIDFSTIESTRSLLSKASEIKAGLVIGTTGLDEEVKALGNEASGSVPVLISPNMSVGVNLLFSLTQMVSSRLKDLFDIEIIEAHHRFKKDSPSGTAKRLGEIIAESLEVSYDEAVKNGRSGISQSVRSPREIGMHAVRGGDIVGDHTVLFAGPGERIELRHMAHSRTIFARGAVVAAKWLANQKPGNYSMKDVLGL